LRSLLTTVLLMSCLILATGRVEGRDAAPEPVDLTSLSLDQLLSIQVALPELQGAPGQASDDLGGEGLARRPAPMLPLADYPQGSVAEPVGPPAPGRAALQPR